MEDNVSTADDLATLLTGTTDNEQTDTDSQNGEATEQETEQEEVQAEGAEGEQSEGEDGEEQTEQSAEQNSAEVFLEWEQNGEKIRVSQDELKNGYMRQQDYTQKTQNLARESQALQTRVQQEIQMVQAMGDEIGQLQSIRRQLDQYQQVDWQALRAQDPLAYTTYLAEYNNLMAREQQAFQGIQGKQAQLTQAQQQAFQQQTAEAQEHLKKVIPNFGPETLKTMKSYGEKMGFSAQELAQVADKRMFQVLWEASQWRALQDKKPALQNKVKALPTKATKPAGPSVPQKQVQVDKQLRRLSQTGKVNDFAALLNSL